MCAFRLLKNLTSVAFGFVALSGACTLAAAAEIKVLTAGAFKPVVLALVPDFEKKTGHKVTVENDTVGGLAKRIAGGEAFDLAVLSPATIEPLVKAGKFADGGTQRLAKVGIGVAVKRGAPLPDVSSVTSFREALVNARAVAYIDPAAGGSSGIYFSLLLDKMGVADKVKPKAVLVPGGLVAQKLVTGEADLAVHQVSEILAVPGAVLVGQIPAEVQNFTVYAGGVSASARDAAAARALLAAFLAPDAQAMMKQKGMDAP